MNNYISLIIVAVIFVSACINFTVYSKKRIFIKEIAKISLAEDELLWITISEITEEIENFLESVAEVLPESWDGRIIYGNDKFKLTKIKKSK